MGAPPVELKAGQVWRPKRSNARHSFRRIVGAGAGKNGDRVVYCTGGARHMSCTRTAFLRWRGEQVTEQPGLTVGLFEKSSEG